MVRYEASLIKRLENLNGRALVICGDNFLAELIYKNISEMGGYVVAARIGCAEKELHIICDYDDIKEICNLNPEKYYVLIVAYSGQHKDYIDCIEELGYLYYRDFEVMGVHGYCTPITAVSPLLGYSRIQEYERIGNGSYVIAVYGDSISDIGRGGISSWVNVFGQLLQQEGFNASIYNGAVSGYSSGQEFLKMCRDIRILNPDLVISFSGIADIGGGSRAAGFPFMSKYMKRMWENISVQPNIIPDSMDIREHRLSLGIPREYEKDSDIWLEHERMMYSICKEFGIIFRGFLEPMIYPSVKNGKVCQEIMDVYRNGGGRDSYFTLQENFSREVDKAGLEYIINLSELFEEADDIFSDQIHYTEKGNRIVAEQMVQIIKKFL